uniref:Uricase n=1 Tax=Aureoumbra lagunensis TaxID=44058 RepID=A0A7S3NR90_9STRA|mmetsp:Transcript_3857/g.5381  ORF Transcript_3857/g.5381 Transcript_3857/m.5381 type:complete len:336 (+) Transcript_3857:192-1199(+)
MAWRLCIDQGLRLFPVVCFGSVVSICEQGQKIRKKDFRIEEHHHGKTRVRVLKVRPDENPVTMNEYKVQTTLWSPKVYEKVFTKGDNTDLVATDTQKNTVYVVAKRTAARTPEDFGIALAEHFIREYPILTKVEVEVEEAGWKRYSSDGIEHNHSFLRVAPERDAAVITLIRNQAPVIVSQLRGMTFIKTTQSGFENHLKDKYTLLPDVTERCLASELSAEWHYIPNSSWGGLSSKSKPINYAAIRRSVRASLEAALFGPAETGHYSPSLQNTIYDAACLALDAVPAISKIAIDTPNLHYLPANLLKQVGESFSDDVFIPTNEPSGSIFCCVTRN